MKKKLICCIAAVLLLAGCAAPQAQEPASESIDAISEATMARYREGEMREYGGVRLNPAVGPRDNSIAGVQYVDMTDYKLTIDGLANTPAEYTYDEVLTFSSEQRLITIHCVEGWDATILWKGVTLQNLLETVEPNAEANTVIFHAADGYTTSLPLSEILDNNLMIAYDANGIPLPPEMGYPFIFVAEDKWGYKWARWINRIELSSDDSYQGFWEGYGYSNSGNLDQPSR